MKKQALIKPIVKMGNSACVLLPKTWKDGKARVELIEKPLNFKKDLFEILNPYLEDIIGVCIVGSYARNEQTSDSDVDVIVISKDIKKEISYGKYNISIYPIENIKKTLDKNPIMIYPRLIEGKTIFNKSVLEELKDIKISKDQFREFIDETKNIIKINKEFIELDKLEGDILESDSVIYSVILRLRAIFLIKVVLSKKIYSKNLFKEWLIKEIGNKKNIEEVYSIYDAVRDNKKVKTKIDIILAERLLDLLRREVKKYAK